MSLKISVSGVRGIWCKSFDMTVMIEFIQAFSSYVISAGGKRILMGRDGRPTGDVLSRFVASIFNMMGLDVVDAGIIPTPTVLFGVRECNYDAGIVLSASHNPLEWNAFKFVKQGGVFTDEEDLQLIQQYIAHPLKMSSWEGIGSYSIDDTLVDIYLDSIRKIVDVMLIQEAKLKVLLDPVNCSGSLITKKLFNSLGVDAYYCHDEMHGNFERPAEPIPDHLTHLKDIILTHRVDVAFAQDPDADRLVVADEKGNVLSEEITAVLALKNLLDRGERGDIVLNMSTSSVGELLNAHYGGKTYRSSVGEANVVKKMIEVQAFYGIEGNGGVIYQQGNQARDSLVGILLILEMLAREKKSLSEISEKLPKTVMKKEKYKFSGQLDELFVKIEIMFPKALHLNKEDGLRVDLEDRSWVHLRASNTEPIIRLIAEASSEAQVSNLVSTVQKKLNLSKI